MQTAEPEAASARVAQIGNFFVGFWGTWLVHLGRELGFFKALEDEASTPTDLAERLGFEADYVDVWCRAAQAYELLDVDEEGRFRLTPGMAEALEIQGPYAGALIQVSHRVVESLEAVFRGTALPEPRFLLRLQMAQVVRASYRDLLERQFPKVPGLVEALEGGGRLIEFGCGCGHGIDLLRRLYPTVEPTGLEVDYDCAREAERATRAVIVVGTAEDCRYDARFDVALFHRSLSDTEDPAKALERGVAALKPGGWLVVTLPDDLPTTQEELRTDRGRMRMSERLFYGMFLAPDPSYNPTRQQVAEWLRDLPVDDVTVLEPGEVRNYTLVFRRRP